MSASNQTDRLKADLLRGVVQINVDEIEGRLPRPLRRPRPIVNHLKRAWPAAVLVCTVVIAIGIARWPVTAQTSTPPPVRANELAQSDSTAPAADPPVAVDADPSLMAQPVSPGVLALGVRRVILDAGHGGDNAGAISADGLLEKTLTLDIARRLEHLVGQRGFDVVLTRTSDATLSLMERTTTANDRRGDIFVSIHINSIRPTSARGVETYYLGPSASAELDHIAAVENQHSGYSLSDMRVLLERIYTDARRDESRRLAESVQRSLVRTLRQTDHGLTDRGVKTAPFVVLVATDMPAILTEVSCLSNTDEAARLAQPDYRQTIAEALAAGIQHFAHETRGTPAERTGTSGN